MSWRKKKKYFNKYFKSIFAQNKLLITLARKFFTFLNETTEGEGIINGAAITIEKGHGGRIKFTSFTLKFADWLYFLNKPPPPPLAP